MYYFDFGLKRALFKNRSFFLCFTSIFVFSADPGFADNLAEIDRILKQAETENSQQNFSEAEMHLKQALSLSVSASGAMASDTGMLSRKLAEFYMNRERYADAEHFLGRALVIAAGYNVAVSDSNGDFHNTQHFLRNAIQKPAVLPGNLQIANTLSAYADLFSRSGRYSDSERMRRRVIEIFQNSGTNAGDPLNYVADSARVLAENQRSLAQVLYKEGKVTEAEQMFKTYVETVRKEKGPSPELAEALNHLSAFYRSQSRSSDAEAAESEAKDLTGRFF